MITLPATLAHQRSTMPQPWSEASHVMMTTWAAPVSPARKAACRVLEHTADEDCRLGDGGGEHDNAIGVELALRPQDGGEERHERADVGKAGGVVLDATA